MKEKAIKVECDFEVECNPADNVGNPVILQYDYGLTDDDNEISILDFLPTSYISEDLKFEELTSSSTLELEVLEPQEIKVVKEEKQEPCEAALAIQANIPTPNPLVLSKWRTFISAAYYHPNILAHVDVADLKELFQLLGTDIRFESVNVMIDLGKTVKEYKPVPYLRPMLPSHQTAPIFNFAHVKDFCIDIEMKVCIVKKYCINEPMKKAVTEMVSFVVEYPEALYLEIYGFILDFLLKFGVQSDLIIDAVMRTQTRRRKCQKPASVLVLKKANRLGKGRKEFLQQRLLESPEQKYHPVVPILEEPSPVRNLRNRRNGCVDTNRTPTLSTEHVPRTSSNFTSSQPLTVSGQGNSSNHSSANTLVFAVKRKLFAEEDSNEKVKKDKVPDVCSTEDCVNVTTAVGSRKKRFYSRRDSSTIEKPFTCTICPERSFAYKGNLVLHMKKKHPSLTSGKTRPKRQENVVPAFSCPVCLQGYASKYRCKAHLERHHPDQVDWEPLSNHDALPKLKKTAKGKGKRKWAGNKSPKEIVRHNARQPILPLSDTQNSSPEKQEEISQFRFNSKLEICANRFAAQKQQLSIHISKEMSAAFKDLPYSTLSHARTRQQLRAAK